MAVSLTLLLLSLDAALVRVLAAPESLAAHWSRPATPAEHVGWVVFALSAGVGEELVYRGYLQQQLMVLSNSRALGVALQAFLFGIAHGEQGGAAVARFALYGALLGCLALLRGSVIPGVLAHVALDTYAGFAQ